MKRMADKTGRDEKYRAWDKELDEFWTLEETMPQRRRSSIYSADTDTVELELGDPAPVQEDRAAAVPPRSKGGSTGAPSPYRPVPILEYSGDEHSLITHVTVLMWPSRYKFYEHFQEDARRFYDRHGEECACVPYFSYIPQYAQLLPTQRDWYFWWRDNLRRGIFLETDLAYIRLYVSEIIDLPDLIPPQEGLDRLVSVWLGYRKAFPKLDAVMGELVCDYCLVNQLRPPYERLRPILPEILSAVSFREFFVDVGNGPCSSLLMGLSSNYDWRKSRYCIPENEALFRTHIAGAVDYAVGAMQNDGGSRFFGDRILHTAELTREAYAGSLCAYTVKRQINVSYRTLTRSPELRLLVTDIVKYAENKVRVLLHVRARLATPNLPESWRTAVDAYFARFAEKPPQKEKEAPAYERQYEPESTELSIENARRLEETSWQVADDLGGFDLAPDAPSRSEDAAPEVPAPKPAERTENTPYPPRIREGIRLLLAGDGAGFEKLARENGGFAAALADEINEAVYDELGDILAEEDEGGWKIAEDYRDDAERIIGEN